MSEEELLNPSEVVSFAELTDAGVTLDGARSVEHVMSGVGGVPASALSSSEQARVRRARDARMAAAESSRILFAYPEDDDVVWDWGAGF